MDQQQEVLNSIPEDERSIFLFLKYHYRRPSEACALQWRDFDEINKAFIIRRTFSARKLVDSTKTNAVHHVPCHDDFYPVLMNLKKKHVGSSSDFVFQNPRARKERKNWSDKTISETWKRACTKAGIKGVSLYQGTKHTACMHFVNQLGSMDELQVLTDHKRRDSVKHYAAVGLERKRELMMKNKKVVNLNDYKTTTKDY